MGSFLSRLFNSADRTVEAHIVLTALGVIGFVGLSAYAVVARGQAWDPAAYGAGLAAIFAGTGAAGWAAGLQRKAQGDSPQ